MPTRIVSGDPLLTQAQALAFGHNARGRNESGELEITLMRRYPAAFSLYRKQASRGNLQAGDLHVYREAKPVLVFMVVRNSAVGSTRYRHVQSAALKLARDHHFYLLDSVAIAPLGTSEEWSHLIPALRQWFDLSPLNVIIYERNLPGVQAEETP